MLSFDNMVQGTMLIYYYKERNKKKKEVVYKISCGKCNFFYVGKTDRALATRVRTSVAIRSFNINNAIAKHSIETGYLPDSDLRYPRA